MLDYKKFLTTGTSKHALTLGTASSLALALAMSPAYAQDADADADEEAQEEEREVITVQGIRSSLSSAQDFKEEADTFLDAITAEDIGALADRSVAEALQRVPGVNIGRFEKPTDPSRFSAEGSGVIIRGLPFVRSELNGRDIFSATGGRELSFNDVSAELLSRVEVFKNTSADMIEGGIAGTVNLVTRNPLDRPGLQFSGSIEGSYGDLAEEWDPTYNVLGSNTWDTDIGTFGLQVGYTNNQLTTRGDVTSLTDPCYRDSSALDSTGCFRANTLVSGVGVTGDIANASNFPPANADVIIPKGAYVSSTLFERERETLSLVGQYESNDESFIATVEYLRTEAQLDFNEYTVRAQVDNDGFWPEPSPGSNFLYDSNGAFIGGLMTQNASRGSFFECPLVGGNGSFGTGPITYSDPDGATLGFPSFDPNQAVQRTVPCLPTVGIPTENLRTQQANTNITEDFSAEVQIFPTDRLAFNFELQHINSEKDNDTVIAVTRTYSDIFVDMSGDTPNVQFLVPTAADGSQALSNYFTNPDATSYWFFIDNIIQNEGELTSFRADVDYDIGEGFFRSAQFGARWSDRNRVTRDNNFGNWGTLGMEWAGPSYVSNDRVSGNYTEVVNPFDNFQNGGSAAPIQDAGHLFYAGDLLSLYRSGELTAQGREIIDAWISGFSFDWDPAWGPGEAWGPLGARGGLVDGTPFLPGEISDVSEETVAFYGRIDFGSDDLFGHGWVLDGNIGGRYVETTVQSSGQITFPFDGNITSGCDLAPPATPDYCDELSPARLAEFFAGFSGDGNGGPLTLDDSSDIVYDNFLPSFNAKLEFRDGLLLRFGYSEGISRPDLASYRTGGSIGSNFGDLQAGGNLDTGPLFQISTGNRLLRPIESTNYDLSLEYYWADVGSLTFSLFQKDIDGLISSGPSIREFTDPNGTVLTVEVNGPANVENATLKGFELSYQQIYDMLPGLWGNIGSQFTYTYIDGGELENPTLGATQASFAEGLPFVGISENTVNATVFYEDDRFAARLAYNWRSDYLVTARNDQWPYSPVYVEETGTLDGSFFYTINDSFKVGVQGVNLLDTVTKSSTVVDFDGNRYPFGFNRSDRRFTFVGRYTF